MQFDKWYFDFQNDSSFGYFYVGFLRFMGLCLNFTEVHQRGSGVAEHYYHSGIGCKKTLRSLLTKDARIMFGKDHTGLIIHHKSNDIIAKWENASVTIPQVRRPVYQNKDGICIWKIWTPQADVVLRNRNRQLRGKGYIDFVRLTIPFWKIPFKRLHWGRFYSDDDWLVLFHLEDRDMCMNYMADKSGWWEGTRFTVRRAENNQIQCFQWFSDDESIELKPVLKLQKDSILTIDRIGLPEIVREKMSNYGFEEKYQVEGFFRNKKYKGIMEEVRWNEYRNHR